MPLVYRRATIISASFRSVSCLFIQSCSVRIDVSMLLLSLHSCIAKQVLCLLLDCILGLLRSVIVSTSPSLCQRRRCLKVCLVIHCRLLSLVLSIALPVEAQSIMLIMFSLNRSFRIHHCFAFVPCTCGYIVHFKSLTILVPEIQTDHGSPDAFSCCC